MTDAFLALPDYGIQSDLRKDRPDTTRGIGSGLLVYARSGVTVLPIEKSLDTVQFCSFRVLDRNSDVTFGLVYRLPNTTNQSFDELIQLVNDTKGPSILMGNFNMPSINWKEQTAVGIKPAHFLEACEEANMEQLITFPTQVRGNVLDLILTNVPHRVSAIENIGRLRTSDHSMIQFSLVGNTRGAKTTEMVPNWYKADWQAMQQSLRQKDWNNELAACNTEQAWTAFKERIHKLVDKHMPTRPRRTPNKPVWMNREVVHAVRRERKMWKRARCGREEMVKYEEAEREATRKFGMRRETLKRNWPGRNMETADHFSPI